LGTDGPSFLHSQVSAHFGLTLALMARRTIVQLEDDLNGGEAEESVSFALDGRSFEIDLSEKNAGELREVLAPYISAGRPIRVVRGTGRKSGGYDGDDLDPATVRAWANANGYAVSTRGRVSRELRRAYYAEHP
jgi:Lsr2